MDASEPGLCFVPKDPAEPCGLQRLEPCGGLEVVSIETPIYCEGKLVGHAKCTTSPRAATMRILVNDGSGWSVVEDMLRTMPAPEDARV